MRNRPDRYTASLPLAMYALWTAGTWLFEGRIETLMRPEATADRLIYALAVNLLLGIVGSVLLLRWLGWQSGAPRQRRSRRCWPATGGCGAVVRLFPAMARQRRRERGTNRGVAR